MIKIDGVDPKMIANNLIPFEPTHPGEVLKDEIEFRGISQKKLAKEMGVSYTVLNEILNAKRSLNTKYKHLIICKWQKKTTGLWRELIRCVRLQRYYD